jgi:hypothetical protein
MSKPTLYQVTLPYACFGVEVKGQTVVDAAPIGRWMVGKSLVVVGEWVARKHGTLRRIEEPKEGL